MGRSRAVARAGSRPADGRRARNGRRGQTGSRLPLPRCRPDGDEARAKCKAPSGRCQASSPGTTSRRCAGRRHPQGYTSRVPKREPHIVLGIDPSAAPAQIKAAWRKLARQHHPDLTGDDPAASRVATRKMAEINAAYAAMTKPAYATAHGAPGAPRGADTGADGAGFDESAPRRGGPPRPRPTRPVTGRLDLSGTFRERNAPLRSSAGANSRRATTLRGHAPLRWTSEEREPPRASHPTGPLERGRVRDFRPPPLPPVDAARDYALPFGKFRGHTLGEVAEFEPSYVDWLARTITREPELVAAARSLQADLDRRGVARRAHPIGENERRAQARGAG